MSAVEQALELLGDIRPDTDREAFNRVLAIISKMIFPENLRLYYARVDELREQDINAQSMTKKMFDQLVENIKGARALESVPLCATVEGEDNTIYIVSGHHRKRGIATAKLEHVLILLYEGLSWSRVKSKQLAHNSIFGTSDMELVKRIWDSIDDVQARFESFIDPRDFKIPEVVSFKPVDVDMGNLAKTVMIVFLPVQHSDFEAALAAAMPKGEVDKLYLASKDTYEMWMQALKKTREGLDVVAVPTAISAMARLALERLEELEQVKETADA